MFAEDFFSGDLQQLPPDDDAGGNRASQQTEDREVEGVDTEEPMDMKYSDYDDYDDYDDDDGGDDDDDDDDDYEHDEHEHNHEDGYPDATDYDESIRGDDGLGGMRDSSASEQTGENTGDASSSCAAEGCAGSSYRSSMYERSMQTVQNISGVELAKKVRVPVFTLAAWSLARTVCKLRFQPETPLCLATLC